MKRSFVNPKHRLSAPVAAVLAASLTAAAFARAARSEDGKLKVMTSLHVLASIAREIGGDKIEVEALARNAEDPHQVAATPQRMLKLRDADAFVESGLQLEIWDDNVIEGARNPKIQKGQKGQCFAADGCPRLQIPRVVNRQGGDLHPFGNPHVWYEPLVGHIYAKNIEACFARISPENAAFFEKNRKLFDKKLDDAIFGAELVELMGGARLEKLFRLGKLDAFLADHKVPETLPENLKGLEKKKGQPLVSILGGLMKKAQPLKGAKLISYHRSWPYFASTYGIDMIGEIENQPGIAPTPGHLQELEESAKTQNVKVVILMPFEPKSIADGFAEKIGAQVVVLPSDVGAEETKDWFSFQEMLVDRVVEALARAK